MGKGNTWSNDVLGILFTATPIPNIAINATSAPFTNLYISLHTANPGAGGTQSTSEAAYSGYARVGVPRSTSGFVISGTSCSPINNVIFPSFIGTTPETETYFGIGTAPTGAGILLYSGALSNSLTVTHGIAPILTASSIVMES